MQFEMTLMRPIVATGEKPSIGNTRKALREVTDKLILDQLTHGNIVGIVALGFNTARAVSNTVTTAILTDLTSVSAGSMISST